MDINTVEKTPFIRQKHYPNNSMGIILRELYVLENIVEKLDHLQYNTEMIFIRRSAIIRLVTIIEQFFHAVLDKKINDRPDNYNNITINIHKALLIDTIKNVEYSWRSVYPEDVEDHIRQFLISQKSNDVDSERCKLNNNQLTSLLEPYCHVKKLDIWHLFIANEHSFQNTYNISTEMKKHGIVVFDDSDEELSVKSYDRLFNARHILVHTMNDYNIDVKKYMKPTMRLFKHVLKVAGYDDTYVDLVYGSALNEAGRYDEAITVLNNLTGHDLEGSIFQIIGDAYYAKGDVVSGKEYLMKAMDIARNSNMILKTQNYPNTSNDLSNDLSHDYIYNALSYWKIGETFRINDEMDLATQCFKNSLTQCPNYISLHKEIGSKFVEMKMNEEAITCFKNVINKEPINAFALNQLGKLYEVSDPKKSKNYYKELQKLEPENELAKHALE